MKKIFSIFVVALMVMSCIAYAAPHVEGAGAVTMFNEPSYRSSPIIQVYSNMPFEVVEVTGGSYYDNAWAKIIYTIGDETYTGYINADYIVDGEIKTYGGSMVVVSPKGIAMRTEPTTKSNVIYYLPYASEVRVNYQASDWYNVTVVENHIEYTGFIARYIQHKLSDGTRVMIESLDINDLNEDAEFVEEPEFDEIF